MFKKADIFIFMTGAILYTLIEIAYRGYSHWSMTLTGGVCLMSLYKFYVINKGKSIVLYAFVGMLMITLIEFYVGIIVNIMLGWNVWDYSNMKWDVLGQICPFYSFIWFILSMVSVYIFRFFDYISDRL